MDAFEDVALFDRDRRKNISIYASPGKIATRGRFYSEDEDRTYDVEHYEMNVRIVPEKREERTTEGGAEVGGLVVKAGRFLSAAEVEGGRPVCVLGADLAENFFPYESPLGKRLVVAGQNLEVVGVLEKRGKFLGMESLDNQLLLPITKLVSDFGFRPGVMVRAVSPRRRRRLVPWVRRSESGTSDAVRIRTVPRGSGRFRPSRSSCSPGRCPPRHVPSAASWTSPC